MKCNKEDLFLSLLRLSMGWVFLWSFLDKLFGLGFNTAPEKAWLAGGSPTFGFLKFAVKGPFAHFYQNLAGNVLVDWLFMLGLLFVGITLILGIMTRIGGYVGALMLLLMYTAGFIFPEQNPFMDEHIVYLIIMLFVATTGGGQCFTLNGWWSGKGIVQKYKFLK
jgi:thiosulfate dehydrogenase [quinone] large subunit